MRLFFTLFLSWFCFGFSKQGVFSPVNTLPPSYADGVYYLYSSYNNYNNTVFLTWSDLEINNKAWYSIFDLRTGRFNTEPTVIPTPLGVDSLVTTSYNSKENTVFICWIDNYEDPWYAIYDYNTGVFTTTPTLILTPYKVSSSADVFCCYNSQNNTFFITWPISGPNPHPFYLIYDCTSTTFSALGLISDYFKVGTNIIPIYNTKNNSIVLTWSDDTVNNNPYFAIFDSKTGKLSKEPTQIAKDKYLLGVKSDVFATIIPKKNQIFMSWNQEANSGGAWYVRYDFEKNLFLEEPIFIDNTQSANAPNLDVIPCYYPSANQVFLSYCTNQNNCYVIYDCLKTTITEGPATITNPNNYLAENNITPIFLSKEQKLFLSWAQTTPPNSGVFSLYTDKNVGLLKLKSQQSSIDYQKGL